MNATLLLIGWIWEWVKDGMGCNMPVIQCWKLGTEDFRTVACHSTKITVITGRNPSLHTAGLYVYLYVIQVLPAMA